MQKPLSSWDSPAVVSSRRQEGFHRASGLASALPLFLGMVLSSCQFRGTKGPWRGLREQKGLCAAVHLESLPGVLGWGCTLANELLPHCGEVTGLQGEPCLIPLQKPICCALEILFTLSLLSLPSLALATGSREYLVAQ